VKEKHEIMVKAFLVFQLYQSCNFLKAEVTKESARLCLWNFSSLQGLVFKISEEDKFKPN